MSNISLTGTNCSRVRNPSIDVAKKPENGALTIRLSDLGISHKNPSELELQIQGERILCILDKTIKKLQVALCLPRLLRQNACLLHRYMPPQQVEFIKNVCSKYSEDLPCSVSQTKTTSFSQTISNIIDKITINDSKRMRGRISKASTDVDNLFDPHMAQVMEMLWNTRELRQKVLNEFDGIQECPATILIKGVKDLKETVETKLSVTAVEEKNRERHLRKAWKAKATTDNHIEETKQLLENQRQELGNQLQEKIALISEHQCKIDALKTKYREDIKLTIHESEKAMSEETRTSDLRQLDLGIESKTTTQQYETLLAQHLAQEKGLRAKRLKIETQLSSWLTKYDADIGERQAEYEEINNAYEEEKAEMDALQQRFDEQEEEYVILMAEKEEEETKMWEAKAYEFLLQRSARRIQRCWRAYRQRKIERRKALIARAKAKKEGGGGGAKKSASAQKSNAGKKKEKGKGKDKGKSESKQGDPVAKLEKNFGGDVFEDLKGPEFSKTPITVDLSEDAD